MMKKVSALFLLISCFAQIALAAQTIDLIPATQSAADLRARINGELSKANLNFSEQTAKIGAVNGTATAASLAASLAQTSTSSVNATLQSVASTVSGISTALTNTVQLTVTHPLTLNNATGVLGLSGEIVSGGIQSLASDPSNPADGQSWYNYSEGVLKVCDSVGIKTFAPSVSVAWDVIPAEFSFASVSNATQGITYESNIITISGINRPAPISVTGGTGQYRIVGEAATSDNGFVSNGTQLQALCTAEVGTSTVNVTIGGVSGIFSVSSAIQSWVIGDDFTTDSSSSYVPLSVDTAFAVSGGSGSQSLGTYKKSGFYHTTPVGVDQTVRVIAHKYSASSISGALLRASGSTGYIVYPTGAARSLTISTLTGSTATGNTSINYTGGKDWSIGSTHLIEITIVGSLISAKIDWNDDGDFGDENESDMTYATKTDLSTGNYCGVSFFSNGALNATVDGFRAK